MISILAVTLSYRQKQERQSYRLALFFGKVKHFPRHINMLLAVFGNAPY